MESPAANMVVRQEVGSHRSSCSPSSFGSGSDEVKESAFKKQKKKKKLDDDDVVDDEGAAVVVPKEGKEEEEDEGMQAEEEEDKEGEEEDVDNQEKQGEEDVDHLNPVYPFYSDSDEEVMEQFCLYDQHVAESEGFDVAFELVPKVLRFGGVRPMRLDKICPLTAKALEDSVAVAIQNENQQKNANLEFVDILKANFSPCAGYIFYITFRARPRDSMEIQTFQTKVFHGWTNEGFCIEPMLFRPQKLKSNVGSC